MKWLTSSLVVLASSLAYATPVGLGIYVSNGAYSAGLDSSVMPGQLRVVDDGRDRYLAEFDVAQKVATTETLGIAPLEAGAQAGAFAQLDWTGVHQSPCHPDGALDDWRLEIDGVHWQHSTCYRGAAWMEKYTVLGVLPRDASGAPLSPGLAGLAGTDDVFFGTDSWWERRFVARVVTHGCAAKGDCSAGVSYAEALLQARGNLHPEFAAPFPSCAASLEVYVVTCGHRVVLASLPVAHDAPSAPYGYGLIAQLARVTPYPAAGYFSAGDTVQFQVTYTDGVGNRLHAPGTLPSYGAAITSDASAAGLRYLTYVDDPTLYWAHKNTQSDMTFTIAGPLDRMNSVGTTPITIAEAFLPQIPTATAAVDGYDALVQIFPPTSIVFPCLLAGQHCLDPVGDTFTMVIPAGALPGTWSAQVKARRLWEGEPLQAVATSQFQVGQAAPTSYTPKLSGCASCHTGLSSLAVVGHGLDAGDHERPECLSCHTRGYNAWFEPDAGLDDRLKYAHLLSERFASMGGTIADVTYP